MKLLSTENKHNFTKRLFKGINAFSVENLAMDQFRNFAAVIEAVEYHSDEIIDIRKVFSKEEIDAKCLLASSLSIPFYFLAYKNNKFFIYRIIDFNNINQINTFNEREFLDWYRTIKQTNQTHPLNNGAQNRVNDNIFFKTIENDGQKWGGNIDGFVVLNNKIICIIDNISIAYTNIENRGADPALFFHKRGPRYETWYSTVKLANLLNVPHLLFTIDKNHQDKEVIGLTVIKELKKNSIEYVDNVKPYERVIYGYENIIKEIEHYISISSAPKLN